jgi:hypothetical protein
VSLNGEGIGHSGKKCVVCPVKKYPSTTQFQNIYKERTIARSYWDFALKWKLNRLIKINDSYELKIFIDYHSDLSILKCRIELS